MLGVRESSGEVAVRIESLVWDEVRRQVRGAHKTMEDFILRFEESGSNRK